MKRLVVLIVLGCPVLSSADDGIFETNFWPGEGVPVLIAQAESLTLYKSPTTASATRTVAYGNGWRIPFDETIHRTLRSSVIVVERNKRIEISCGNDITAHDFKVGDEVEYLQYAAEGYGIAKVAGKLCLVPFELEAEAFGSELEQPETQWWVRMTYADGSSRGWLLVTDEQVSFGRREF